MRLFLSVMSLGLVLAATPAQAGEEAQVWVADFDKAVEIAKKEKKNLLVDFTGSDWCHWCIKLHEEVFDHAEFLDPIKQKFILVALDFPNGDEAKAKVPNPERNKELAGKYGVRGYPTVLLMTPEGEVFGRTGYRPGGPTKYAEYVGASAANWKTANEIADAWEKADDAAKTALMTKAADAMVEFKSEMAAKKIKDMVAAALAADPENKSGLKMKAVKGLLKMNLADEAVIAAGRELDPKNEQGMFELALQAQFMTVRSKEAAEAAMKALGEFDPAILKDKELGFGLCFTAMRWSSQMQNKQNLVKFATMAKKIGTDNAKAMETIDKILEENKPAS
jgi:thioredoxin-related protein